MKITKALSFILLTACATHEVTSTGLELMTESQYEAIIDTFTDRIETYKGLYNAVQVSATIINTPVAMAQIDQKARLYQWDQKKFNSERSATQDKLTKKTEIFVSFYTPERKHDDLHKSDSVWKIFLDVDGQRFEGKATKMKEQTIEIAGIYSYHTRFSTPYSVTFPVSTKRIENQPSKLTLTGPAGSAQLNFRAVGSQTTLN
jgi:hypothetical protein